MNLIGTSFDIHKLKEGKGIVLGGIKILCELSTIARSDGDVVLHALSEAIFASLGMEDLGTYFPESDPATENMNSKTILNFALQKVKERELNVQNVTVHILLQTPRLNNYKSMIKASLSNLLNISPTFIAVHAGTTEGMGEIGNGLAIGAFASVLLTDNK